jgi:hypothetical protein
MLDMKHKNIGIGIGIALPVTVALGILFVARMTEDPIDELNQMTVTIDDVQPIEVESVEYMSPNNIDDDLVILPVQNPSGPFGEYTRISDRYYIQNDTVYYDNWSREDTAIEEADPDTFESVEGEIAKDSQHVYVVGLIIEGADPKTFEHIERDFYRDARRVYKEGVVMDDSDPDTFTLIPDTQGKDGTIAYAIDSNHVYDAYSGEVIEGADPNTYEWINYFVQKDNDQMFVRADGMGKEENAVVATMDPATFEQMDDTFYRDKNSVYYIGSDQEILMPYENYGTYLKKLDGADPKTFTILSHGYVHDAHGVWFWYLPVEDMDPTSLIVLDKESYGNAVYAKDAKKVCYRDRVLTDLDPSSVELPHRYYMLDDENVYYMERRLEDLDRMSFEVLSREEFARDNDTLYFTGHALSGIDPNEAVDTIEFWRESPYSITYLFKDDQYAYSAQVTYNTTTLEEPRIQKYVPKDIAQCSVEYLEACGIEEIKG